MYRFYNFPYPDGCWFSGKMAVFFCYVVLQLNNTFDKICNIRQVKIYGTPSLMNYFLLNLWSLAIWGQNQLFKFHENNTKSRPHIFDSLAMTEGCVCLSFIESLFCSVVNLSYYQFEFKPTANLIRSKKVPFTPKWSLDDFRTIWNDIVCTAN